MVAIVPAAGSGERLGLGRPKAFVEVGGRSLIGHAIDRLRVAGVQRVVVAVGAGQVDEAREIAPDARIVVGGADRVASVAAGLAAALDEPTDVVLVHDAARAFAPSEVVRRVVAMVRSGHPAVVPVLPVIDTIRAVDSQGDSTGVIDRTPLRIVQTPQGFSPQLLVRAHEQARRDHVGATDDAALVERLGEPVSFVPGDARSVKITTAADLDEVRRGQHGVPRVGVGFDVHQIRSGVACHLAGLYFPDVDGCHGHSDGDVAAHALCDALLSAAGLGDLGSLVGTDDPRWAGASGVSLIEYAMARVHAAGYSPGNASVQIAAADPRIGSRRREAEQVLSAAVGAPVSVAATTTDRLGFVGRREGRAAMATALIFG